jgi:uncharacterized protein YcbK (DUF882 family)
MGSWTRFGWFLSAVLALQASPIDAAGPRRRASAKKRRPLVSHVQAMVGWHAPDPSKAAPLDDQGRPMLSLFTINQQEALSVPALSDDGGFRARDLDRVAHVLRSKSGIQHPVEPRTLNIIYRIQRRFGAHEIRIVSGYRTPKKGSHSNHGKGRAIDFVVPGVPDLDVARYAREIGFVGVGIYPTSQFVHVDVRPRSYFWVDYSGPGKRNRERGISPELALWSDQKAAARGERGIEPFLIMNDVDRAAEARQATAEDAAQDDDDDDDDESSGD